MAIFKNKEYKLLIKMFFIFLVGLVIFQTFFYIIVGGEPKFDATYQSVIQRKYDKLVNTDEPKIIIVGGSNAGFGIDIKILEEKTGYAAVNMGLHAGFGPLFNTEIVKKHVDKGDILILAYEYGLNSQSFEKLGDINLIMSAIDNKAEMYREIPLKNISEIFGNIFKYAEYKAQKNPIASGAYSSAAFDDTGNMIYERNDYIISNYQEKVDVYGAVYGNSLILSNDRLEYLCDLKEYVEKKGASIYFTSAVLLEDAYQGTEQNLLDYANEIERKTEIKYISNPNDYLFHNDYMYDTIYHCNTKGQVKRTELLIDDLKKHNIIS